MWTGSILFRIGIKGRKMWNIDFGKRTLQNVYVYTSITRQYSTDQVQLLRLRSVLQVGLMMVGSRAETCRHALTKIFGILIIFYCVIDVNTYTYTLPEAQPKHVSMH